eukprot:CCRYP_002900-RA/>CCRYP_002900-RA protein AED:0.28 eAED:0.28 QI:0/0/0/1/1/1/2/0/294
MLSHNLCRQHGKFPSQGPVHSWGGHVTKAPATLTYARVMSLETVWIALLLAVLNGIDIWADDVLNAYITTPCHKKIWTTLGKEFGNDCGWKALVVRALYGLKSRGAAFRVHLTGYMSEMGYVSCTADADLWLKEQTDWKGRKYYSYVLCYLDDVLVIHHNPKCIIDKINSFLPLKPDLVGPPEMYLDAKLKRKTFEDGTMAWGLPPRSMFNKLLRMLRHSSSTISKAPKEDVAPLLEPTLASYFMQLIGVLRWMCELRWIDICTEVSMLSSFAVMLHKGHLEAALHVLLPKVEV